MAKAVRSLERRLVVTVCSFFWGARCQLFCFGSKAQRHSSSHFVLVSFLDICLQLEQERDSGVCIGVKKTQSGFRRNNGDSIGNLGLFNGITHPNLRAVEIRSIGQWPYEEFKAFLTRSHCSLRSMIFDGGAMATDWQQFAAYVTLSPSLKSVTDPMCSTFYFQPEQSLHCAYVTNLNDNVSML
ncbi:hypothetical protein EDD22DRAFT_35010 [Suillus occidentalis]|nr:hypothetical protein EDD22DRAFT_35010 [Suillus occidentalis]